MYDLRQFKPSLYLALLLGLTGFGLAAESPGLWGFCVGVLGINAWLVRSGRYAPLPRWLANLVTLLAVGYVVLQIWAFRAPPLMFIGQFLAFLQLIKLFELRANRDYAQLLVLSLLLMVAAAINTASLLFGVLLLVYLVVSLFCCLIFHLKVEADRARAAFPVPPDKVSPITIQQDRHYLSKSMRRLTALVWVVATGMAVVVFIFFPRGAGMGVLGQLQFKAGAMTGFSDRVSFDQINNIKQNEQIVAHVMVWKGERRVEGTESLFLRGLTLDTYGPDPIRTRYQWTRSRQRGDEDLAAEGNLRTYLRSSGPLWRQQVRLEPSDVRYLFALPGVVSAQVEWPMGIRYLSSDESLHSVEAVKTLLKYEVVSTNQPSQPDLLERLSRQILLPGSSSDPAVLARIREYALRPEVTDGLAARRSRIYGIDESNEEIARRIERHLKTTFSYTLDLRDHRSELRDGDPVYNFLTKVKRGHCEYFASAMTLMCQSLGIPARMVVGFRCGGEAYNIYSYSYVVRQSHAHTWVEVLTPRGWVTFDPTSSREDSAKAASLWQSLRQLLDFLEYKWAEHVVTYDARDRDEMLRSMDNAMTRAAISTSGEVMGWRQRLRELWSDSEFWTGFYNTFFNVLSLLIALMAATLVGAIVWYLVAQWRLRRRAARIGFGMLPRNQQIRLARQLAFYDELTRTLQRHQIVRPAHLTAREFADSLVFLPEQTYQAVRRLTALFYRVRFGSAQLNPHRQRRLEIVVTRLSEALERTMPRRRRGWGRA